MLDRDERPAQTTVTQGSWFPAVPNGSSNGAHPPEPETRDDVTRYLCAAAHLDDDYADNAIREYLTQSTRQVPPSLGVDAGAVLAEAVAARTRRKLRDWVLTVLATAFVLVAPIILTIAWTLLALLSPRREHKYQLSVKWVKSALKIGVPLVLALIVLNRFGILSLDWVPSFLYPAGGQARVAAAFLLVILMLAVLMVDEFVVWRHLFVRFQGTRKIEPISNRAALKLAPRDVRENLRAYINPCLTMAQAPNTVTYGIEKLYGAEPVIVYRSYRPFVGAGNPVKPFSIAVPLEPLPDVVQRPITTDDLYAAIATEVGGLRRSTALAPGMRLRGLALGGQIVVSAGELLDHLNEPEFGDFLPSLGERPYTFLRKERVREIRANPLEWARYYQYYRLETWDRDLMVSVFVHVAVDESALYLEWTPCVLLPIKRRYYEVDMMSDSKTVSVEQSLRTLLELPASMPLRVRKALSVIRPERRQRPSPDMYGVARTLRELAQGRNMHNYLQLLDQSRYLKLMRSRLVQAVSRFMKESGYSTASFLTQAGTVINNSVQIGGSMEGNVIAGGDNSAVYTPGSGA